MARKRKQEARAIIMESARVQLASVRAGIIYWSGWIERAAEFAESASHELRRITDKEIDMDEMVGRFADLTRTYLRRITELPGAAAAAFDQELKPGVAAPIGKRKRAARVKE